MVIILIEYFCIIEKKHNYTIALFFRLKRRFTDNQIYALLFWKSNCSNLKVYILKSISLMHWKSTLIKSSNMFDCNIDFAILGSDERLIKANAASFETLWSLSCNNYHKVTLQFIIFRKKNLVYLLTYNGCNSDFSILLWYEQYNN